MKFLLLFPLVLGFLSPIYAAEMHIDSTARPRIYLIPGQGSDTRIFNHIDFSGFDTTHIVYVVPQKNETMSNYAQRILQQIDTTQPFSLIGVSLGGMIATEITKKTHPTHTIIISSARTRYQLPYRYRLMRVVPINRLFKGKIIRAMGIMVQPLVEPDSRKERTLCKSMLQAKHPLLLERGINMIIHWDNEEDNPNIIHIHGTKDHTLPYRRMDGVITVKNGSHMMALTRGEEVGKVIRKELFVTGY